MSKKRTPEIWKTMLKGRQSALADLFDEFYDPLLNYGLKLTSREAFVKDCIQDVFTNIWNKRENLSQVTNVQAYLFTSLRMRIFEVIRQNNSRKERQKDYVETALNDILNIEQTIIRDEREKKKKSELKKAVIKLSERQKEAVLLKFFYGFSNDEISEIMQINKQSVYNLVFESIQKLENYLDYF